MLSLVIVFFIALMLPGVIARTRALLSGRKGVRLYQHINGLCVLMGKDAVYSPVSGMITRMAPVVSLAALLTAALLVPVGGLNSLLSFEGDIVLFCYLLALSRVAYILAALDSGSSFQGMGASREALYGALAEPALFIVLGTLALVSGYSGFSSIFRNLDSGIPGMLIVMVLSVFMLFRILLVEAGRIPVDDPRTHLELTMIHEVMVLDYCGFDLGLITLGGWLKTALLAVVATSCLSAVVYYNALLVVLQCLGVGIGIGIFESVMARNRLARNTTYIATIAVMAFVVFMVGFLILQDIRID